jgi:hypothetical protein
LMLLYKMIITITEGRVASFFCSSEFWIHEHLLNSVNQWDWLEFQVKEIVLMCANSPLRIVGWGVLAIRFYINEPQTLKIEYMWWMLISYILAISTPFTALNKLVRGFVQFDYQRDGRWGSLND